MNKQKALRIVLAMANDWMETIDRNYACSVCECSRVDIMEALEQVTQMQQDFESVS